MIGPMDVRQRAFKLKWRTAFSTSARVNGAPLNNNCQRTDVTYATKFGRNYRSLP